ncbi:MAG: hypothetical protein AAFP19_17905 [Bacteroidota bacterium]
MLDHWLAPVSTEQFTNFQSLSTYQLGKRIAVHHEYLPNLSGVQIALLGIGLERIYPIRQALYQLNFPFRNLSVADLGNARRDEPAFLIPIISELLENGIFPIIIGPAYDTLQAQFQAYQSKQQLINLGLVDEAIRFDPKQKDKSDYLYQILTNKSPRLFSLGQLAYQSHYTPETAIDFFQDHHFDLLRLGHIRQQMEAAEPLIRNVDLLGFNIAAIRYSDAPAQQAPNPAGLFIEEACQLCRYAGLSDKLTSLGIYGYQVEKDQSGQTAQAIALLIWYFLEGFHNRKKDYPVDNQGLIEYIVDFKELATQVTFWKSSKSGRWWMQVPVKTMEKHQRHYLIPCSYQDYLQASKGDFPERLFSAYQRFV